MKKFSTTIKRKWLKEKISDLMIGGYFIEYKDEKPFWDNRICDLEFPTKAVFLCGMESRTFNLLEAKLINSNDVPNKYKEAITMKYCWALKCVRE